MIARIRPAKLSGTVRAIPSKSEAHRLLICAALADSPTRLEIGGTSQDIEATIRCLAGFGAKFEEKDGALLVQPIDRSRLPQRCCVDCGESGSTLRFLLPLAAALGIETTFQMGGRLPERPIAPLDRELARGGCVLDRPSRECLRIRGKLTAGEYSLPGQVSSQYITGMLLALTLCEGESRLEVVEKLESAAYVDMTLQAMARFGAEPQRKNGFCIHGGRSFTSPDWIPVEGDWSNAAFWLCANALEGCDISVLGLNEASLQGDRQVVGEIAAFLKSKNGYCVDAANIPDLVPALAACAAACNREMRFINARRLRIKESDRIASVTAAVNALGGSAAETDDGLVVRVCGGLRGGRVDAAGDHRIAMMAAIASIGCTGETLICGAEAVNKSYPYFWKDFNALGGQAELMED